MIQHINLLRKRRAKRGAVWLAVRGMALVFVLLVAVGLENEYTIFQLRESDQQAQATIDSLTQELGQLRRVMGLEEQQASAKQANVMRSEIDARHDWMEWIQKGELGTINGYSGLMQTLAAIHEEGVWLQGVDMSSGKTMVISGRALNNDMLMRYANQVTQTLKPQDYTFTALEITRENASNSVDTKAGSNILNFKLY